MHVHIGAWAFANEYWEKIPHHIQKEIENVEEAVRGERGTIQDWEVDA
jgi:hypothetical protein